MSNTLVAVNQDGSTEFLFAHTETALVVAERRLTTVHDVKSYYEFLGVNPHCTMAEIKSAGRRLAMEYHPDFGGEVEKFIFLQEALDVLLDPVKRQAYDELPPKGMFLTGQELQNLVASARVKGDLRTEEEILSSMGIETFALDEAKQEESTVFPYTFYYEAPAHSIHEDDLKRLSEWHDMLFKAALDCGWKGSLRVGMRKSIESNFEVERRQFADFSVFIFVLKRGVNPTAHMSQIAMAYANSNTDFAHLIPTLSRMYTRQGE